MASADLAALEPTKPTLTVRPTKGDETVLSQEIVSEDEYDTGRERANRNAGKTKGHFFRWFDPEDGPLERRLLWKLDFYILAFACAGYIMFYIDRGILSNAYVSGMKKDLKLYGNELVQLNTVYRCGTSVSNIPATVLITKYRSQYIVPSLVLIWGVFTVMSFRAGSFGELVVYRLFVGLAEGPFFCSIEYVLGSWYRADEIVRRAGIFYISSSIGQIITGLLAARIYTDLDGALGHAGWRWMYLIGGLMALPIALFGIFTFPGTPNHGKRWVLTDEEFALAKERMVVAGRKEPVGFSWSLVRRFLGRWHFWLLVPWNVSWLMGFLSETQGVYTLWLKSHKAYNTAQVNRLTSVAPAIGVITIALFSFLADKYGPKSRLWIVGIVAVIGVIANMGFALYDHTSFAYKWFTYAESYTEVSLSSLQYSWANVICRDDAEERAFVVSAMLAVGSACDAWVPNVFFKTTDSPKWVNGHIFQAATMPVYFGLTATVYYFNKRAERRRSIKDNEG
ncbi:hypothetical protein A1O3_03773 [Capronia epimyces CBS 606.96]|uniref:Major facilitator superfamily (MFS) profile domain-containing protein n=1 Tax=Capronia epimyces CBS 606.96 TaxID=1182542 RepID=W9YX13_9EURO|nr:uncharacterized protein A1O3_03773 [Capronia epimyces CBS 606.96]EXJ86819.1 hypothetical protein A1O3_03773 [Capronia epimyces CBS 606.96]